MGAALLTLNHVLVPSVTFFSALVSVGFGGVFPEPIIVVESTSLLHESQCAVCIVVSRTVSVPIVGFLRVSFSSFLFDHFQLFSSDVCSLSGGLQLLFDAAVSLYDLHTGRFGLIQPFQLRLITLFHCVRPLLYLADGWNNGRGCTHNRTGYSSPQAAHTGTRSGKAGCVGDSVADCGNHLTGLDVAITHGVSQLRNHAADVAHAVYYPIQSSHLLSGSVCSLTQLFEVGDQRIKDLLMLDAFDRIVDLLEIGVEAIQGLAHLFRISEHTL